jgi:hypothetical protein
MWNIIGDKGTDGSTILRLRQIAGHNAREGHSLEVDHRHRGRAYPSRGWSSTPEARRKAAARGAARSSGADTTLVAAGKTMYGGFA